MHRDDDEVIVRRWTGLQWLVALLGAAAVAVAMGIPSALIANPFFVRMIPAPWWSYAVWLATAALSGVLLATYVRRPATLPPSPARAGLIANVGSFLAVGCPVCNKLVIAAFGVSGALNLWAPIQPLIAVAALALLVWALWRRVAALRACPLPASAVTAATVPTPPVELDAGHP